MSESWRAGRSRIEWIEIITSQALKNLLTVNCFKVTNFVFSLHVSLYQLAFPMLIQHISGKRPTVIHTPAIHIFRAAVHYVHSLSLNFDLNPYNRQITSALQH